MSLPGKTATAMTRNHARPDQHVLFGGRIKGRSVHGPMTTGASNDFERATSLATW
jgi:ATP-dependent Zn protease